MQTRATLDEDAMTAAAEMIRVLGHPVRLRLVEALEGGERCVSDLQAALGESQANVSQQLARMRAAGIVVARRDGTNVCYRVADDRVLRVLECIKSNAPAGARTARATRRAAR